MASTRTPSTSGPTTTARPGSRSKRLPGFPNLLANGAASIAVGMATSIPAQCRRNKGDALRYLIRTPMRGSRRWSTWSGPDFPTGGCAGRAARVDRRGLSACQPRRLPELRTLVGRATTARPVPHRRHGLSGQGKLIERIAEIINTRKLPILGDVHDGLPRMYASCWNRAHRQRAGGAADGTKLFRLTDLEIRFPLQPQRSSTRTTRRGS